MKLTNQQINSLYTFTRQHYVEYYDLQTELVDHLANDIETIWIDTPSLTFERARDQSFKKFGVYGFMDVIEKRQKTMHKRYLKYLWNYLKEWFKLPQIIITLTIFSGFYMLFNLEISIIVSYYIFAGLVFIFSTFALFKGIMLKKEAKRRQKASSKTWMLQEIIFQQNTGGIGIFYLNMFSFCTLDEYIFSSSITILITSICFTIAVLVLYISYSVFPKQAEKLLNETYPEYKLIQQV